MVPQKSIQVMQQHRFIRRFTHKKRRTVRSGPPSKDFTDAAVLLGFISRIKTKQLALDAQEYLVQFGACRAFGHGGEKRAG